MIKTCKNCGKTFKAHGTTPMYCSRQCADTSPERRMKISDTRKKILRTEDGGRMFSEAMEKRNKLPYYQRKDKPESRQRNIDAQRAEYRQWRNSVIRRDNYTCQKCGKRGVIFQVHHIRSYANHPELRYDIGNGITLCLQCHSDEHGYWIHTTKTCPICHEAFIPHTMNQICCSVECARQRKRQNPSIKPLHICAGCGNEFRAHRYSKKSYCSRECYWNSMRK